MRGSEVVFLPVPSREALRILVVDDNRDAAESLAYLLELHNYSVKVAYDGREGYEAAQRFAPDCLISDINMPILDGYGLAKRMRADAALSRVKLIALSAYSDEEHIKRAREVGFDFELTKASDPNEIVKVLNMIQEVKKLACKTEDLAQQNADLAVRTFDLLRSSNRKLRS
jgi:DNA-binding response OmpR family regulator